MAGKSSVKIKKTHGKTWVGLKQEDFLTPDFMKRLGGFLLDAIIFEARKDLAKQGGKPTPEGAPEGIPASEKFFESFSYKVDGTSIEIHSTWPWIEQITEGRKAYPMEWLTRNEGVSRVPMGGKQPGTVLIKSTPSRLNGPWIHPGFRKNNFLRRGYEKARRKFEQELNKQVEKILKKTPVL
jgi:hypothetical protein